MQEQGKILQKTSIFFFFMFPCISLVIKFRELKSRRLCIKRLLYFPDLRMDNYFEPMMILFIMIPLLKLVFPNTKY